MSNLAIIPARGGSKRIPGKNIRDFMGLPVIAYSIRAAIESGLFEEIMVSTDDSEIAVVAKKYGAKVPFLRSATNSSDTALTMDVLKEVEQEYKLKFNKKFDLICCIYPIAPLINSEHLVKGHSYLQEHNFDAVFPVVPFSYPIWRGLKMVDGKTSMVWPDNLNIRSQDMEVVYHDAGQWYWYNPLKIEKSILTHHNISSIILSELEVQDIDTLTDWKLAELKFRMLNDK